MKINIHKAGCSMLAALLMLSASGCKKFFDVNLDEGQVVVDQVFGDDASALSSVTGMYVSMTSGSFSYGGASGISVLAGLSADEFRNVKRAEPHIRYEENNILPTDNTVTTFWSNAYRSIYQANDIIEELGRSAGVSKGLSEKLTGECLFVRAFCHFYLVNLFGNVPLVLTADYRANAKVTRTSKDIVYQQVIADLREAIPLLGEDYPESERVRPNRYAAQALLARVCLYTQDWQGAEEAASTVIGRSEYQLENDLGSAFLIASREVIWQLASDPGYNTRDGGVFQLSNSNSISSNTVELRDVLQDAFDADDKRLATWIKTTAVEGVSITHPNKYVATSLETTTIEHFVTLRLAEQYLIRAEARAHRNNPSGAIADIDEVRERAGLELLADISPNLSDAPLLQAIMDERQKELFSEWGHRWFDLKRTGTAITVLSAIKPGITADDLLYPLPAEEFLNNPFLGDQNTGY